MERVLFSPNQMLSASVTDYGITIWDSSSGKRLHLLDAHPSSLNLLSSVVFSHDSQIIASSSHDYILRLWETASGKLVKVIEGHEDNLIALAFSSDRTLIASGSWDKTIRLWDIESGKALRTIDSTQILSSLAFSHDNKQLAACFYDYTVRVWDTASGTLLVTLRGGSRGVSLISVAFSPNGKLLAASCLSGYLMLWDTASGVLTDTFPVNEDLDLVSFSEDGTLLNTNWGSYCINNDGNSTSLSKNAPHVEIGNSGWIQYEQARILWLPPEYRTKFSTYRDNLLLLGHDYGQVSFIRFNDLAGDDPSLRPV
jgi:WD40 repeat protein